MISLKLIEEGGNTMIKLSVVLAVIGLALLLFSVLPGQATTSAVPTTVSPTSAPAAYSQADIAYGKALFSAKGCVTCHHHAGVPGSGFASSGDIPDLTSYRWNADYLRGWLKNPSAIKPGTYMPNLGLKNDEIEALIAFLSAGANG
jgi:cytochrome c2